MNGPPLARLWHWSGKPLLEGPCPPACRCRWWTFVPWDVYDGEEGEWRTAYANQVWEALSEPGAPLPGEREVAALGERVSILFAAEDARDTAGRYGDFLHRVDAEDDAVLAIVPDPNPAPWQGAWIVIMRAGAPMPLAPVPDPGSALPPRDVDESFPSL